MSIYDFAVTTIAGVSQAMAAYRGKTMLIVNVASQCGYTPQYAGLERLYRAYRDRGFIVLGFPCDQFGHQEPGTNEEIAEFCRESYDVTFPLFAKIAVRGERAEPLFEYLKSRRKGVLGTGSIKWNFTKFLVGPDGDVLKRFAPGDPPDAIERELRAMFDPGPSSNREASR